MTIHNELFTEFDVFKLLLDKGKSICVAESCTGGLFSKRITDIPGASQVFLGGVVAYCNEVKSKILGIDLNFIEEKNAVSREIALAMADGIRNKLGGDIGLAITGIAGPDSDSSGLKPGFVFVALSTSSESFCRSLNLSGDRDAIRHLSASHAFDMVYRLLTNLPVQ